MTLEALKARFIVDKLPDRSPRIVSRHRGGRKPAPHTEFTNCTLSFPREDEFECSECRAIFQFRIITSLDHAGKRPKFCPVCGLRRRELRP